MKTSLSPEKAFQKIKHYCAYQERNHYEVREKLYGMGLFKKEVETLITRLIEEDYLNEARYAIQFAGGHFRLKKWGKIKIRFELRQKGVSDYNIKAALKEIDEADYLQVLSKLAREKWASLKAESPAGRHTRTTAFLLRKGYENNLIQEVIAAIY
ncbi:regulatory protein RecX [Asinibacterium sp. OR53]|uniref:regulatory protein RecX n=1 Tax=Asinibacterium sp. OR53 TaxID=925409 RepID=UPI00047C3F1A|nr:RecX family transcriptional regulator [Asinibacterium sp. OR53]